MVKYDTNSGHVRVHNINKNISDIGSKEIVLKFFGNTVSGEVVDVTSESIVNVVFDSETNQIEYVFNEQES